MNTKSGLLPVALATLFFAAPLLAQNQNGLQEADRQFAKRMQGLIGKTKPTPEEEAKEAREAREEWDKKRKAGGKEFRAYIKVAQMALGRFGYLAGPFTGVLSDPTVRAIKDYQKYNHIVATGNLDLETYQLIMRDMEFLDKKPVPLPKSFVSVTDWDQYVSAKGTWVMLNAKIGYPYNEVKIECFRNAGICVTAIANVLDTGTGQIGLSQVIEGVDRWDNYEILTAPHNGVCDMSVLKINRATKVVSVTTSAKLVAGVCKDHPDIVMNLQDGSAVWEAEYERYKKEKNRIMRGSLNN